MLFKLAMRNVRRSVRDYAIYFITLLFGVAIFYAFNSIGEQRILFDIESAAAAGIFDSTQIFIYLFSVVVAIVLGFLVLYANRMLIGRRRHEFGTYLTLGMSPGAVSRIVLYETVFVGIASLAMGIALGLLLSQLLSFITAAIFQITLNEYHFVFSVEACLMTLVCFAVIYVVVTLFNIITVNRFKLITLLHANAKNEKVIVRNPWVCLVAFVLSLVIIALAYATLSKNGLVELDLEFWMATLLMLVGTFLFFWSIAGFIIAILTKSRGIYFRGLVPFTVRQIASKINTAFLSLWIVCVMLFFAITTFSVGMGLISVFVGDIEDANPYDATLISRSAIGNADDEPSEDSANDPQAYERAAEAFAQQHPQAYETGERFGWDMEACLGERIPNWNEIVSNCAQFNMWQIPGVNFEMLFEGIAFTTNSEEIDGGIKSSNILISPLSEYNDQLELQGKGQTQLGDNEYLIINNLSVTEDLAKQIADSGNSIEILGHTLSPSTRIMDTQLEDNGMLSTALAIVVPDSIVDGIKNAGAIPYRSVLNIDYTHPGQSGDDALSYALHEAFPPEEAAVTTINGVDVSDTTFQSSEWPVWNKITKQEMVEQAKGFRLLISYLALYIGFVFLIATAAILAIQQISLTTDSEERYKLLSKLGCDASMIQRSVLVQVLVYFLAPLALAVCHSACAISVFNRTLLAGLSTNMIEPIFASVVLVIAIYGSYMLVTYLINRMFVKSAIKI